MPDFQRDGTPQNEDRILAEIKAGRFYAYRGHYETAYGVLTNLHPRVREIRGLPPLPDPEWDEWAQEWVIKRK